MDFQSLPKIEMDRCIFDITMRNSLSIQIESTQPRHFTNITTPDATYANVSKDTDIFSEGRVIRCTEH